MSDSEDAPTPAKVQKMSSSVTEVSSEADTSTLDDATQKALEDIDSCQTEIDVLNEKASEEILQVEMKYNKLRRPHFEKRNSLIKHIHNFWVTAFLNHPRMANIVEEDEEECLQYLRQVDVEENEDIKSGYTIRFHFANNPYFTDEVLVKEFHLAAADGKPMSVPVDIHWKPNMDLTKYSHGKQQRRRHGEGRSFFFWLTDNVDPTRDRIAEMIKDDLWPNPLQYYLASDIEVEENGLSNSDDDNNIEDDSVVIVGDDDDDDDDDANDGDDDDVYEVEDEEENEGDREEFEETVESIEVEDDEDNDDDDDAIHVLGSDSEAELEQGISEISQDADSSQQDSMLPSSVRDGENSVTGDSITADSATAADDADRDGGDSSVIDIPDTSQNNNDTLDNENNEDSNIPPDENDGNDSDLLKDDGDDDGDGGGGGNKVDKNEETSQDNELLGVEGTEEGVD